MTASLELPTVTHSDRLAAAAAITAKARAEVDSHSSLAAEVDRLKTLATDGELDDAGAINLNTLSEKHRIAEITAPRRQRALDDALAHEVKESLAVLAELAAALEPVKAEAEQVADKLTAALVHPDAAAIRGETTAGQERDRGRCMVEQFFPGVFPAAILAERIHTASQTTWGSGHCPQAAAEIVETFDTELAAIKRGVASLRVALRALEKSFG
jgi:hypothetical protein